MPRRPLDHYETPPHYVEPLLALIGPLHGLSVYEPCVGAGHIARYLTDARHLCTNDINPDLPATMHQDAQLDAAWPDVTSLEDLIDWTITNPPFSLELPILQHALRCSRNVAFLGRISFLEPTQSRSTFWFDHPPSDLILLPRYSFRLNDAGKRQTDNVTCCWMVWREGHSGTIHFSVQRPLLRAALPRLDDCDNPIVVTR